jgi:hypothetical protein
MFLNHVLSIVLVFVPIYVVINAHCKAENVNMFNLVELLDSIKKVRKK